MASAAAAAAPRTRWVAAAGTARRHRRGAAAAWLVLATGHLCAGGGERVPWGAERFRALPVGAARGAVPAEPVQRVAGVSELPLAVGPRDLPDQGLGGAAGDREVGDAGGGRRPGRRARPRTCGHGALVGLEGVQGEAPPIGEDGAERGMPQRERRRAGGGRAGGWAGRGRTVRPPAAAAGRGA